PHERSALSPNPTLLPYTSLFLSVAVTLRLDNQIRFRQDLRMRTNLAGDRQTIRLWPAEVYSRGDRSGLPFRRIWESTQSNFPPCSQPQHFRTVQGIFSRETSGCRLSLQVSDQTSDFGPQSYTLE